MNLHILKLTDREQITYYDAKLDCYARKVFFKNGTTKVPVLYQFDINEWLPYEEWITAYKNKQALSYKPRAFDMEFQF